MFKKEKKRKEKKRKERKEKEREEENRRRKEHTHSCHLFLKKGLTVFKQHRKGMLETYRQ